MFHNHKTHCLIMIQDVSYPWINMFHPDSSNLLRIIMICLLKTWSTVSVCCQGSFSLIIYIAVSVKTHDHQTNCFILIYPDSRCLVTIKWNVSSWFSVFQVVSWSRHKFFLLLIHGDSTCFITVSTLLHHPDSSCFELIQPIIHCFFTVLPVSCLMPIQPVS